MSIEARFAYLADMPQELQGNVASAADMFDMLLHIDVSGHGQALNYMDGAITRVLSYLSDIPLCAAGEAIQDTVVLRRSELRAAGESYELQASWGVVGAPPRERFETDYLIEMYPHGPAYARIWQPEPSFTNSGVAVAPVERTMELGDFVSLHETIGRLLTAMAVMSDTESLRLG